MLKRKIYLGHKTVKLNWVVLPLSERTVWGHTLKDGVFEGSKPQHARAWWFLCFGTTVRELPASHLKFLWGLHSPCSECIRHTMKHLFIFCRDWGSGTQTRICSFCCVVRGRYDQNILDEGRLTDEKSSCVHSWAQMRLDNALSNENFFHLNV